QDMAASSKTFDMLGTGPASLFHQGKYLTTSCGVTLEFARQAPEICLDCASTAKAYNFQILLAELHVKMHTLNPEIVANHNKQFAKQKAQIPLKDCMVRSAQIPTGSTTFMSQTLMNGKL